MYKAVDVKRGEFESRHLQINLTFIKILLVIGQRAQATLKHQYECMGIKAM